MDFNFKDNYDIDDLVKIVELLRSENGCPWDKEQTHKSIRKDFIEETYEVIEAIDNDDPVLLREELGDVLLQVVFHSQLETEEKRFSFDDVVNDICYKLIIRHPHVFGDVKVKDTEEVLKNWNNIKQDTKHQNTYTETLESVCSSLPALMRAQKTGQRAKRAGLDFADADDALIRLTEEIEELKIALKGGNQDNIEDELGDVLFSAVNVCRLKGIDAEEALTHSTDKFVDRFRITEELICCDGLDMKTLTIDKLDAYWQKAKKR